MKHSSHIWSLPSDSIYPLDKQSPTLQKWKIIGVFADFRHESSDNLAINDLQSIESCSETTKKWASPSRLLSTTNIIIHKWQLSSPFKTAFIEDKSKGVIPETLRRDVIDSLENGFKSGYRGGGYFQRDFSKSMTSEETKLARESMLKEVKKGHCLGPFNTCPFPNQWCNKQAYICQLFFRDKHKFVQDGQKRLIGNKSYPENRSFNDLVPRQDTSYYIPNYSYFTLTKLIAMIKQAGPNCLLASFDAKDAFKNCRMATSELWQQVYKVGQEYFIDLGGTFGSRNAGDA